jgi:hypothetical protein
MAMAMAAPKSIGACVGADVRKNMARKESVV